jgi:hypothetical protein
MADRDSNPTKLIKIFSSGIFRSRPSNAGVVGYNAGAVVRIGVPPIKNSSDRCNEVLLLNRDALKRRLR